MERFFNFRMGLPVNPFVHDVGQPQKPGAYFQFYGLADHRLEWFEKSVIAKDIHPHEPFISVQFLSGCNEKRNCSPYR